MTVCRTGTYRLKLQQGRSNLGIRDGFFPMVKITLGRFAEGAWGISHVRLLQTEQANSAKHGKDSLAGVRRQTPEIIP